MAKKTPTTTVQPDDPQKEAEKKQGLDIADLGQYAREKLGIAQETREKDRQVLSGQHPVELAESEAFVEVGGSSILVDIDSAEAVLITLREVETALQQGILQPEEQNDLDELFKKIRIKFPEEKKILETLERLKALSRQEEPIPLIPKKKEPAKPADESKPATKNEPVKATGSTEPPAKKEGEDKKGKEKGKGKEKPRTEIEGEEFEVPLNHAGQVKKILSRVRRKLARAKIDSELKERVEAFLVEVSKRYQQTNELDATIDAIRAILEKAAEPASSGPASKEAEPTVEPAVLEPTAAKSEPPAQEPAQQPPAQEPAQQPAQQPTQQPTQTPPEKKTEGGTPAVTPPTKEGEVKKSKEEGKRTAEEIRKLENELLSVLKDDPDFVELIRLMQILKTNPRSVEKEEWSGYLKKMLDTFGTERVEDVLRKIRGSGNDLLIQFVDPSGFMQQYRYPRVFAVRKLLVDLENRPKDSILAIVRNRTKAMVGMIQGMKISAKPAANPAPLKTEPPKTEPVATEPAEERAPDTMRSMRHDEVAREAKKVEVKVKTALELKVEELRQKYEKDAETLKYIEKYQTDEDMLKAIEEDGAEGAKAMEVLLAKEARKAAKSASKAVESAKPAESAKPESVKPASAKAAPSKAAEAEIPGLPREMSDAILKAAEGDEDKKKRLLELWEVAQPEPKLEAEKNRKLSQDIKDLVDQAHRLAKNPKSISLAANALKKLLASTKSVKLVEVTSEAKDLNRLRIFFDEQLEEEGLDKLRELFADLFAILEADPRGCSKPSVIESIQKQIRHILLNEVPSRFKGMTACSSMEELLGNLNAQLHLNLTKGFENLDKELTKNEDIQKMVAKAKKLMGVTPKEPPPAPPAPPAPPTSPAGGATTAGGPDVSGTGIDTSSSAPSGAPTASATGTPSAVATDLSGGTAPSEMVQVQEFPNYGARFEAVRRLVSDMGFAVDKPVPAVRAILSVLNEKVTTVNILNDLEQFMKTVTFETEADKVNRAKSLKQLENEKLDAVIEQSTVNNRLTVLMNKHRQARSENSDDFEEIGEKLRELNRQKFALDRTIKQLDQAIEKRTSGKTKETQHYETPEQLLGMIMMYFAKQEAGELETPNYIKVLEETHKQLEKARQSESLKRNWIPHNFLKPGLSGTLQALTENVEPLKKVKKESMAALAKIYNKPDAIHTWITELEGSEEHKMKTIVPSIMACLSAAVNDGRMANINFFSINSGRTLLANLRREVHEFAIERAKKTGSNNGIDRMNAYFSQLNEIEKNARGHEKEVISNSRKVMGWRLAKGVAAGMGAGAVATLATLTLPTLAGIGVAGAATGIQVGKMKAKDPKTKEMLNKMTTRCIVGGGLGVAALATTPWLLPLAAGGLVAPELWKNRRAVWEHAGRRGTRLTGRGLRMLAGVVGGPLLFSETWRKMTGWTVGDIFSPLNEKYWFEKQLTK